MTFDAPKPSTEATVAHPVKDAALYSPGSVLPTVLRSSGSGAESAMLAAKGQIGNLELVADGKPIPKGTERQPPAPTALDAKKPVPGATEAKPAPTGQDAAPWNPSIKDLRASIAQRDKTPSATDCDLRPQSPDVAPVKPACDIDLPKKGPEALKSVVGVVNPELGIGNGVYVCKSDGSFCGVVTNNHVVPEAGTTVLLMQGTIDKGTTAQGKRVASDPEHDLALLEVSGGNLKPTPAKLADGVQKGDSVFAACRLYTENLQETPIISAGHVMRLDTPMGTDLSPVAPSTGSLQMTFHGCSGTANFDKFGNVAEIVKGGKNVNPGMGVTIGASLKDVEALLAKYNPHK